MDVPARRPARSARSRSRSATGSREGDLILLLEAEGAAAIPPKEKVKEDAAPSLGRRPASYGSPAGVYETIEVKVPDIGDFKDVPVIEIHGQRRATTIKAEDPLLTLESDKATMEMPVAGGRHGGRAQGQGRRPGVARATPILTLQTGAGQAKGDGAAAPPPPPPPRRRPSRPAPRQGRLSTPRCWCWAPGRAATPPPSAPPTSASRWCWSSAGRPWAASA